jgi:hypothetical protein
MRNALYYPHTQMRDENFLKNSLLLWDEVDFISPTRHFRFDSNLPKHIIEGLELLCRPHVPNENEKGTAHTRIVNLLKSGVPDWLVTTAVPESIQDGRRVREFFGEDYGIYPEKLDHKTWELLEAAQLVRLSGADYDYYTRPLVGLFLMSLLANVCAGNTKEQITDRGDAYAFLWRLIAAEGGGRDVSMQKPLSGNSAERLITLSLKAIDTDDIPFENILALRKREAGTSGHDYRAFRKKYGEKLKECAVAIATNAKSESDRRDIERQFKTDLADDLNSLKDELQAPKRELVFSKEVLTTVAVAVGVALFAEPTTSVWVTPGAAAVSAGLFVNNLGKFVGSYKKTLKEHSASWLYLAQAPDRRSLPIRNLRSRKG